MTTVCESLRDAGRTGVSFPTFRRNVIEQVRAVNPARLTVLLPDPAFGEAHRAPDLPPKSPDRRRVILRLAARAAALPCALLPRRSWRNRPSPVAVAAPVESGSPSLADEDAGPSLAGFVERHRGLVSAVGLFVGFSGLSADTAIRQYVVAGYVVHVLLVVILILIILRLLR